MASLHGTISPFHSFISFVFQKAHADDNIYSETQLPREPFTDPTQSYLHLPRHASTQLPAGHPEDPSYASLSFQKNPSSNNDSVLLNEDQLSCVYAAVKFPSHT